MMIFSSFWKPTFLASPRFAALGFAILSLVAVGCTDDATSWEPGDEVTPENICAATAKLTSAARENCCMEAVDANEIEDRRVQCERFLAANRDYYTERYGSDYWEKLNGWMDEFEERLSRCEPLDDISEEARIALELPEPSTEDIERSCYRDAGDTFELFTCAEGEICQFLEDRCVPKLEAGEHCPSVNGVPDLRSSEGACTLGTYCIEGICTLYPKIGEPCVDGFLCGPGATCENDICVAEKPDPIDYCEF